MGGINSGWLVGWLAGFRARTGSVAYWSYAKFVRLLGEAIAPWGVECGPCPYFASKTLAFALQLRKITENLIQGSRRKLGWSTLNAIRSVDLAIANYGLDWPAVPCRPWLSRSGSTLGQRICRVSVLDSSPHQLTFRRISRSGLWWGVQTAERPYPRVSACYLRTRESFTILLRRITLLPGGYSSFKPRVFAPSQQLSDIGRRYYSDGDRSGTPRADGTICSV